MSQFNVQKNSTNPDQVYFDLTVTNFESTTTVPPVFYFNESRTMPFIENPEDYFLSIVRFTVETTTLPTQIVSIQPNQTDVDATIYSVTLEYNGTAVQTFIKWKPQDVAAIKPLAPAFTSNGLQNNDTGYYFAYSYTWFIDLVNEALSTCFGDLQTALLPATPLATTFPPSLQWDTTSNRAILNADVAFYNTAPNPESASICRIFFNAPLFTYFSSLPSKYYGYTGVTQGRNFQPLINNTNSLNLQTISPFPVPVLPQPTTYRSMSLYQEVSTIANWTPITSIVFLSATLPIVPNQVSTPLIFNNAQQVSLGGNNAAVANIVTDLVVETGEYRPNLVYIPSAQYRLLTLRGNQPLKNLDLEIAWRTKSGNLVPFRLGSGQTVTMKIAFLKKDSVQLANHLNPLLPTTSIKPNFPNQLAGFSLAPNYHA